MLKNEFVVISMTRQDLDEYIEKYHLKENRRVKQEIDETINQKQAAALFGVTPATIIRWQKKGVIPFNKVGNTVFYYKAALLEAAQKNHLLQK